MARIRVFVVLVLALAAGGVFAFGTYNFVQQKAPAAASSVQTRPVVVATTDLDIGAEIRASDVRVIQWPASSVPQNVFSDPKDVVGRGLILPVIENEPYLPIKLASKEAGTGLPPAIPPGLRAVSVRVNEVIGVAGYVVPGTRVDVVATVSPTQQAQDMTSKVILTDVQVLAAGTKIERDADSDKPIPVNVVTLLVNPEEAERLTLAANEGKIQLALRNPLDKDNPVTRGVRPAGLLGNAPPVRAYPRALPPRSASAASAAPAAAAVPAMTVEIIRGDKRAHEAVRQED
jgi:pilus assembly protein CpaB